MQNLKISLGYTPRELFGDRSFTAVVFPPLAVHVNTDFFGHLCDYVSEILHNTCKISPAIDIQDELAIDYDAETLMWVTALQVESKLEAARLGTCFSSDMSDPVMSRVQRTNLIFPDALTPIAIGLDQLGKFSVNDQLFVPVYSDEYDFVFGLLGKERNKCGSHFSMFCSTTPAPGLRLNFLDCTGRRMFARIIEGVAPELLVQNNIASIVDGQVVLSPQFLEHPYRFNWFGLVEFVPGSESPAPPTFEQIANRYFELRGRVSKKLTNAFVEINASSGKGSEAQIVYREQVGNSDLYTVWSPRKIRSDSLEMGAMLALGYNNNGLSLITVAAVEAMIDTSGGR